MYPQPPQNLMVVSPFIQGVFDLRWDDPALLSSNSDRVVVGVNIYRSDSSDRGPYRRVNAYPVGGGFFRDYTDVVLIASEVVPWGEWQSRGDAPNLARWTFKTLHPIFKPRTNGVSANASSDVLVYVNGVPARVASVFGPTGEVTLESNALIDPRDIRFSNAPLPSGPDDVVTVTYYTLRNMVQPGVDKKSYYRVTTVVVDPTQPGNLSESRLQDTAPASDMQIEALDYIWREAIRRNRWILEQGGERVKLFTMKTNGIPCLCTLQVDPKSREYGKQPSNLCRDCFGVGFVGGYEGPYDIIVAPDDAEKRISQTSMGRRKEHSYEVWMSFSPIVSQRDFIVKQNNDRYSIGPVRRPTNRGNVMQQHFNIQYIDSDDIRYKVPIDQEIASPNLPWPQTRYTYSPLRETYDARRDPAWPVTPDAILPLATNKSNEPDELEERGRTGAYENITG